MPPIDSDILKQIILLQSTLHVMNDDLGMARFLCRGLSCLSSIQSVGIHIGGKFVSEGDRLEIEEADQLELFKYLSDPRRPPTEHECFGYSFRTRYGIEFLRIETALKLYGILFLKTRHADGLNHLAPYIENTLNIMALMIENNQQKEKLLHHQTELEALVQERTRELENNLCQLEAEISDRRRAENRLSEALEWHQAIFDGSRDAIFISDESAKFIFVNDAACELTGFTGPELLAMRIPDLHEAIDLHAFRKYHGRIMAGEAIVSEAPIRRKDGRKIDAEFSNQRVRIGDTAYMHTTARDITERKKAERALWESTERFQKVFHSQLDAIFVLNADTPARIIDCNTAVVRMFGYEPRELIGRTVNRLHLNESRLWAFRKNLGREMESRGFLKDFPYTMKRKDGTSFPSEHTVLELTDDAGNRTGWISVVRDLTDRRQMEERLRQAQKMEAIGALAGGIAHDFNNLLFPILGLSDLLLEDIPPDDPNRDSVGEIHKAARRAGELTQQILSFSRQSEHKKAPTLFQPILKEVLKLGRATIPADIVITRDIQPDCGHILADPTQLHQIVMNLLTNAYHAVESTGGRISIRLQEVEGIPGTKSTAPLRTGRYAALTVSDTGCGIAPALMEKIFEPYFTTKDKGKGTGLGLAVVYGIVRDHGGEIRVRSDIGRGTDFDIYLPLATSPREPVSENEAACFEKGVERILLVDDEAPIVRLVTRMLERSGYRVDGRTSSTEAWNAFEADPDGYDLVITDMNMPRLTGDRLARKLIALRPDLPIIICTGFSEKIDAERALDQGIRGFLKKPVDKSDLARLVRKVLDETRRPS